MTRVVSLLVMSLMGVCVVAEEPARTLVSFKGYEKVALPSNDQGNVSDVTAIKNDLFAVSTGGGFYRLRDRKLERLNSTSKKPLHLVWGRKENEVYAAGERGLVLHFDGKKVRRLGEPIQTIRRKYHPAVSPREVPVEITYIWATAPDNVFVAARKGALLHFDGQRWTEISFGPVDVIVRDSTRLGRHVANPIYGPIWSDEKGNVLVAKLEVNPDARRQSLTRSARFPDERTASYSIYKWKKQPKKMAAELLTESYANVGYSPHRPTIRISSLGPSTRFQNKIQRWKKKNWEPITKLPATQPRHRYRLWAMDSAGRILLDGRKLFDGKKWLDVESPTKRPPGGMRDLALADDGTVAIIASGPKRKELYVGRMEKREQRGDALSSRWPNDYHQVGGR